MIQIPKKVTDLLDSLHNAGFDAYIVGGAVRDYILGREPHDWDIASAADPDTIQEIFQNRHLVPNGIQYGTVVVDGYEITTFRSESTYSDGRHPDEVAYAKTIEEDLKRRDFTINAMALDPTRPDKIIDPYDGQSDLQDGLIRCVGDPKERFTEDALRMMRAIRFAAKFDFKIAYRTWEAILDTSDLIQNVSAERICAELEKTLKTKDPGYGLSLLYDSGILDQVLPEVANLAGMIDNPIPPYMKPTVFLETTQTLNGLAASGVSKKEVLFAALLCNVGKAETVSKDENLRTTFYGYSAKSVEIAENLLRRLKFSNEELKYTLELIRYSDAYDFMSEVGYCIGHRSITCDLASMRRFVAEHDTAFGEEFLTDLHTLQFNILLPHSDTKVEVSVCLEDIYHMFEKERICGTTIMPRDLKVNGNDLMKLGLKGKEIGEVLNYLYNECLKDLQANEKDRLLEMAAVYMSHRLEEDDEIER